MAPDRGAFRPSAHGPHGRFAAHGSSLVFDARRVAIAAGRACRPGLAQCRPGAAGGRAGARCIGNGRRRRAGRAAARLRQRSGSQEGGAGEMHAQFRRYRLDADLGRAGADDDHPGPRPLLRRHGAQEERRRHRDDQLRHHLPGHGAVGGVHLQHGVHRRHAVPRRVQPRLPAEYPERRRDRRGQSQSAGGDDPRDGLYVLQITFAIIQPALIAGAFAERMKFSAMLWFIGLWAVLVYAPVAHWVWGPDGFLNSANNDAWVKVLDFAGGTVVHINSGVAGLMCALMLGKRRDSGPAHNVVLTFIGASLLWVGWFGFNAGSAVSAGIQAGMAMTVTQIATAVAGLTWMFIEWAHRAKPTVVGVCTGAVAGLVAITPASGFVGPAGSMAIGVAAGFCCYLGAVWLKNL